MMWWALAVIPLVVGWPEVHPDLQRGRRLPGKLGLRPVHSTKPGDATPLQFSAGFSDNAVLQRGPGKAAIYGMAPSDFKAPATVTIEVTNTATQAGATYTAPVEADTGLWKALLAPQAAGGDYTMAAWCSAGCTTTTKQMIQNVTYGDVWWCSGQSNMELIMLHTFSRNESIAAIKSGKYHNIRMYQHPQISSQTPLWMQPIHTSHNNPLTMQWNTALMTANKLMSVGDYMHPTANLSALVEFSAACYYFAQSLTDRMGEAAIPLGMMDVSWGGTMIEQWTTNATTATCKNVTVRSANGLLYNGMVGPFANTTVKGYLWYQGENNVGHGTNDPNYLSHMGYGCQLPAMVNLWRQTWSATPGTTDPKAPFGIVDLAYGTSEGHGGNGAMGNFRWGQTANYGVVPNPALPNAWVANAYDIGDPWAKDCFYKNCCTWWSRTPLGPGCSGDMRWNWDNTTFFMGPIHPRPKKMLGERLAQGAFNLVYGGKGALSGPVIAGCTVNGKELELRFQADLLKGDKVIVQPYNATALASNLQILQKETIPSDGWHGGGADDPNWIYADIKSASDTSITVDLSKLTDGPATGIRYAWEDREGCGTKNLIYAPCPPASYPIMSQQAKLPAMPFLARITGGKCQCIPPQKCDA